MSSISFYSYLTSYDRYACLGAYNMYRGSTIGYLRHLLGVLEHIPDDKGHCRAYGLHYLKQIACSFRIVVVCSVKLGSWCLLSSHETEKKIWGCPGLV